MKLTDLLEEFNVVIDTAEGLTELRSLILGLAVRGKLVPQDPNDEPALELLKKIEAEKERLYEEGQIRKPKKTKVIENELIESLPNNWLLVNFPSMVDVISTSGHKIKKRDFKDEGKYPIIDQGQSFIGGYSDDESKLIKVPRDLVIFGDHTCEIKYVDFDFIAGADGIKILRPFLISAKYFYWFIYQAPLRDRGYGRHYKVLKELEVPLPPLTEQHRIVKKIESLFAEVDELEAKLNRQTKLDEKLQLAVNAEVQQAPDAEASQSAWNFITSNFDTLYYTPKAIDNLKKNILNEAVRGRLVPQNPNDEPAFELLKKIEAEKERLYEEGEIRKPKKLPPVKEDEIPFEIPESWEWCRFEDSINELKGGFAYKSGKMIENSNNQVIRLGNVKNEGLQLDRNPAFITDEYASETEDYRLEEDDILITMTGTREKKDYCFTAVVRNDDLEDRKLYLNQRVGLFKLSDFTDVELYNHFLKSDSLLEELFESATGTANQANISMKSISNLPFPVPPLEEQHRIVQRIEELFAICDQFKTKLQHRQQINEKLVKGLVKEVLEGV